MIAGFSDVVQAFADNVSITSVIFQTKPGTMPGVNPWQNANGFFKKKFFICLKNQNIKI